MISKYQLVQDGLYATVSFYYNFRQLHPLGEKFLHNGTICHWLTESLVEQDKGYNSVFLCFRYSQEWRWEPYIKERERKPSSASFAASYGPKRFTLLWQLEVTVRKLQQQGEPCWSIGFGEISRNRFNIGFLASHFLSWTCSSASSSSSPSYFFLFCSSLLPFFMLPLFYLLIWFNNLYISKYSYSICKMWGNMLAMIMFSYVVNSLVGDFAIFLGQFCR